MTAARFIIGDTRQVVANLPAGSVDLVLTSPPFLALRSYLPADHPDKAREIGSEPDPATFIDMLLELTALWARVLAPHGSIAVELGDTYSGSGRAGGDYGDTGWRAGQDAYAGSSKIARTHKPELGPPIRGFPTGRQGGGEGWPLPKSLALVPELYRIGLAYGINPLTGQPSPAGRWMVRNVVRWVRPNPPVGALGDKFRPATSEMVIATRDPKRWFDLDAVRTEAKDVDARSTNGPKVDGRDGVSRYDKRIAANPAGAPPLDWWEIVTKGYEGAHYATWPPELCVKPIEAMCPRRVCRTCGTPSRREVEADADYAKHLGGSIAARNGKAKTSGLLGSTQPPGDHIVSAQNVTTGWSSCGCPGTDGIRLDGFHTGPGWRPGIVLDPFGGTGTTGMVATGHGRDAVLVDLDDRNADLARDRIGMLLTVETHQADMA